MIEEFLMNEGKKIAPELTWTANFLTKVEATGTVYDESGPNDNLNSDTGIIYPEYMFWIQSPIDNWDIAKIVAYKLYGHFHKQYVKELIHVPELGKNYRVFFMEATSQPLRIGVEDDVMKYSLNLRVTLREE